MYQSPNMLGGKVYLSVTARIASFFLIQNCCGIETDWLFHDIRFTPLGTCLKYAWHLDFSEIAWIEEFNMCGD
jgi:hypothetical protein